MGTNLLLDDQLEKQSAPQWTLEAFSILHVDLVYDFNVTSLFLIQFTLIFILKNNFFLQV